MDQTVWNTINGRIFQTSNDSGQIISRLAGHADFVLILLSPSYLLWSHPKMLLLIQTLVLGIGGVFVFLIAKEILKNKNFALLFGFLFLVNPLPQFTNLYDFHPVSLATTFLLASFYFLIKRKYLLLTFFLILSGLTKEQVWAVVLFFGFPLLIQKTKKIKFLGAGIIFFSLIIFWYLIWHAIPQKAGGVHFALSYFSDFGDSPTEVVKNFFISPQKIASTIFEGHRLDYLRQIFMPLGFLSLLSPLYLIFAIPDLLINLLSNNTQLHQIYYQYTSTITPFIFISSIFAVKKITKWFPKLPKTYIIIYLFLFSLYCAYSYGPLPYANKPNTDMLTKLQSNGKAIEDFLSKIPEKYTVAATNNLGSHVSHRQRVFTVPLGIGKADFVIFLLNPDSTSSLSEEIKMSDNLRSDKNYTEVYSKDHFVVFKKRNLL